MEKRKAKAMPDVRVDGTITNEELRIRLNEGGISSDDESVVIEVRTRRRKRAKRNRDDEYSLSDNDGEEGCSDQLSDDMNYYYERIISRATKNPIIAVH